MELERKISYGSFADSDDATESSDSPRPSSARRVNTTLARRLTLELIDRDLARGRPSQSSQDEHESRKSREPIQVDDTSISPQRKSSEPLRYPGAIGLPSNASDDEDSLSDALRRELSGLNMASFSAPTSPESLQRRHRRLSKVGTVLGLTNSGLRRETLRMKQSMATRLLLENESYNNYVNQTIQETRGDKAGANSMLLTSEDIPLEVILQDPVHRKTFRMHAESNMSAEPLLFWERVNDYRQLAVDEVPESQRLAMAANIWSNFLDSTAEMQLLVRETLLLPVRRLLEEQSCRPDMFDAVQQEAYSAMQFSLYPEYLAYLNASRRQSSPTSAREPKASRSRSASLQGDAGVPTLRDCLVKPQYAARFRAFAGTLLCAENIEFWQSVNQLQATRDPEEISVRARRIYDDFLSPSSPMELNVGSKTRRAIRYEVENDLCTSTTFNDAQREIYKLISLDVYPKFCQEHANNDDAGRGENPK